MSFLFEPFYIGKGSGYRITASKAKLVQNKIQKLKRLDFPKEILCFKFNETPIENLTLEMESLYIRNIGRKDLKLGPLLNLTNGGEKGTKRINSQKTKNKMRQSKIGKLNPNYGKKHKKESILKMNQIKNWKIIDPLGKILIISNLANFCREHNLNANCMTSIAHGRHKQHKKYKCYLINAFN